MSEKYEIDLNNEEILALSDDLPRYVRELVKGKRIHKSTAYRWALRGVRGRRLPTVRIASRLYTTKGAFSWWVSKLSEDLVGVTPSAGEESVGPEKGEGIDEILRRAGIKD